MFANLQLAGTYRFDGKKYTDHNKRFYLVVSHRVNPTVKKYGHFLLAKTVDGKPFPTYPYRGNNFQYVSSMYPVKGTDSFLIEYLGNEYKVDRTGDILTISTWHHVNRTDQGLPDDLVHLNHGIELLPDDNFENSEHPHIPLGSVISDDTVDGNDLPF